MKMKDHMSSKYKPRHKATKYIWDDGRYSLWKDNKKAKGIDSDKYHFVLSMLQENL